jgi:hypothetical protein
MLTRPTPSLPSLTFVGGGRPTADSCRWGVLFSIFSSVLASSLLSHMTLRSNPSTGTGFLWQWSRMATQPNAAWCCSCRGRARSITMWQVQSMAGCASSARSSAISYDDRCSSNYFVCRCAKSYSSLGVNTRMAPHSRWIFWTALPNATPKQKPFRKQMCSTIQLGEGKQTVYVKKYVQVF